VRFALWESPFALSDGVALASPQASGGPLRSLPPPRPGPVESPFRSEPRAPEDEAGEWLRRPMPQPMPNAMPVRSGWERLPLLTPVSPPLPTAPRAQGEAASATRRNPTIGTIVGHNLLMMAGLQGELPPALIAALQRNPGFPAGFARHSAGSAQVDAAPGPAGSRPNRQVAGGPRWSADA